MTLGDIAKKARALTKTDSVSYPDANLLIDINIWYQKVVSMIFESQDSTDFDDARATNYPIVSTPMIANQRDYPIPVSERMLKIKRVDMAYNGVDWYRANPMDSGAYPAGIGFTQGEPVDAQLDQNFLRINPFYDVAYSSIWLFPMPTAQDVANGGIIRVEWQRNVIPFTTADYTSVLTDSTVAPGFDAPFHPILAWGAAFEYATAAMLPQTPLLTQQVGEWEQRIRVAYGRKNLDERLMLGADMVTNDYGQDSYSYNG